MRILPIASGSSGNCIYVGNDNTHLLIDAGISKKRIEEGLNSIDLTLGDMNGILVTHEHSDHTTGLRVCTKKNNIPIYSSKGTLEGIMGSSASKDLDTSLFSLVEKDTDFMVGDLEVHCFKISHDANEPLAFTVTDNKRNKISVVTDLGYFDDYILENLKDSDAMLVEANHDIRMLQVGSYPYKLKQRILSDKGHLSNEASGKLINSILNNNVKKIYLGHLSKENNFEDLAFETVKLEIDLSDNGYKAKDFNIEVAKRDCLSSLFEF